MKKVLMLGGDYGAIELAKTMQKNGYYVIATDYYEHTPLKEIADEAWWISTGDIDLLAEKCMEAGVEGVLFGVSEFNTVMARKLCQVLNLPIYCDNDRAWEVATNKYEFKQLCRKCGAPVLADYEISSKLSEEELAGIEYPVVVKPIDQCGNHGMSYCTNKEELIQAYHIARAASDNEKIIVERQLHGPEFSVNYLIANGEPRLFLFSTEYHQTGELANLYSIIISTSHHLKQYLAEVNEGVKAVFREAGCKEGVAWVECILDQDSKMYLLEMGYRFGSDVVQIPYKDIVGFDSLQWMIDIALGKKHLEEDMPEELNQAYKECAVSYLLFSNRTGVIGTMEGLEEISKIPGVLVDIPKRVGRNVTYHTPIGVIRFASNDCEGVCETIRTINSLLKVLDENGENMIIYYDNYQELLDEYVAGLKEFECLV